MKQRLLLSMLLTMLLSMLPFGKAAAQEAYAVREKQALTFYYDSQREARERDGRQTYLFDDYFSGNADRPNFEVQITNVSFDASFRSFRPKTTAYLFSDLRMSNVSLNNLNTSEVTDMCGMFDSCPLLLCVDMSMLDTRKVTDMSSMFNNCFELEEVDLWGLSTNAVTDMSGMFKGCKKLMDLNLTSFNTRNVTNMDLMFMMCEALTSITVGDDWSTASVTSSEEMFTRCYNLVGGAGTTYDDNHVDAAYAHIDGGTANPGYLTLKPEPYAEFADNTLTFYYDIKRSTRTGTTYNLNVGRDFPGWSDYDIADQVNNVIFDPSFADARPTSTRYWFYNMKQLTSITGMEQYLNTSEVTDMSDMFEYCIQLESLDLSGFDTRNVTDMSEMFYACNALKRLDLSSFDTRNVTSMNNMFRYCTALESLDLSGFDTRNLIQMNGMFFDCEGLTSLDLSSFDTRNVITMWAVFNACYALKTIDLSSFDTRNVDKSMEQMFASCWQLQTIIVGSHWTTYYTENTQDMFKDCMNLVGSAGTTYDANHTDGTYAHADGGTKYPGYLTYKGPYAVYADGTLTFYNDTERGSRSGKTYDLNEGDNMPDWVNVRFEVTSVVFDPSFAKARPTSTREWFSSMTSLESITGMTKYLNTSEVTTMVSMFFNCSILTTLDLSGFDTRNVAHMDYMFYNSRALTTIYVSGKWSTENLTSSDYMFYNCESLVGGEGTVLDQNHLDATYAHIDGGTANPGYLTLKLEAYAEYVQDPGTTDKTDSGVSGTLTFYYDANRSQHTGTVYDLNEGSEMPGWYTDNNCRNVTSVVFDPSFADARPTSGFRWFSSMSALESITDMKEYLNTSEMTSMTCMFEYCRGLKSLDLSSFDTRNVQDMVDMFNGCVSLKELDLSSFDTRNVTSMNRMFYGCQRLEWLNVGSFNTQNVRSMEGMFGQCMSLTDLDLRSFNTSNVTKMDVMFIYCYELVKVYVGDGWNVDNVGDTYDMFYSCNNILGMRGTAYDADHTGGTYAHIDEGTGNPGYLSLMPYAVYRENRKSLTFYNDDRRSQRQEPTYDLGSGYQGPGWWVDNYTYTEINRVTFDQTFQYARPNSTYGWFAYMENLEEINGIEYLNTSNVKFMRAMFYNCKKLMDFDLSYFDTRNVTDMNDMFNNCSNLTRLDLSSFDTRNVTDMTGMFYLCQALDSINVSSFDTQNVENMWAMFAGCYYLRELDLSSFDTRKVKNMTQMFYDDSRLKTITVGQGWSTKAVTESGWMFYGCWNLVGGAGTVYDEDHIDSEYAHVDGGSSNPGYLTLTQNIPMGDVNLDGQVGIGDIVAITNVMAGIETNPTIIIRADVNGDNQVGIGDIVAVTNIMAGVQ